MPLSLSRSDAPGALVVGLAYRDVIEQRGGVVIQAIGGVCINVASHLARSGLDVELATLLDPGAAGDALATELAARGLALRTARAAGSVGRYHVRIDDGEPQPLAVAHPDGEPPAEFVAALRDRLAARPGRLVLELGASRTMVEAALGAARAARVPCVGLPTRVAEIADWPGLLAFVDVVVLNRQEAAAMLGRGAIEPHDALAAGRALCGLGARAVVLTLGAAGAVVVAGDRASWHAAPGGAVVSSLGAGDALAAGVVAGLLGGLSLSRAVDAAMPQVARTLSTLEAVSAAPEAAGHGHFNYLGHRGHHTHPSDQSDSGYLGDSGHSTHRSSMYAGKTALVVLSGGQDSTTCLFWAKREFARVHAVCFSYSQRHATEIDSARTVASMARVELEVVDLGPVFAGMSPLTNKARTVHRYASAEVLPGGLEDTFVPGRNILFLTVAANRAYVLGADAVVMGLSQEDYGGYPDCRAPFVEAMQSALRLGLDRDIEVVTPLVRLDKRATVMLAAELDGALDALAYSHTCYAGEFPPCGHCHACLLRKRGFDAAGIPDPLLVRARGEANNVQLTGGR